MDILALLLALALVFLNGFFVATEFAIVKVRPTRIEELVAQRRPGSMMVRQLVANIDGYLSATQLGITLASLGLGWLGEPAFHRILHHGLQFFGMEDPAWLDRLSLLLAFSTISFLHIVVGELAPKSLAILRAESVAMAAAYPMRIFYILFWPAIWSLNGVANMLLKAMGLGALSHDGESHSEEEIKIIVAQARSAGLLSTDRADILRKAISLPSRTARYIMVPRNEVIIMDINLSTQENLERARGTRHTRFPLCDRELDEVIGIIDVREVLFEAEKKPVEEIDLRTLAAPPAYFPELMSAERLLVEFRSRRVAIAVIVDEYGGASGIVTPADVVSVVLGDIEDDDEGTEVVPLPGGAYDVDGAAPLEELGETLNLHFESDEMRTVAGFLMERLGRMPRVGDRISEGGFSFNVLAVGGPKVRRVRIQRDGPGVAPRAVLPSKES